MTAGMIRATEKMVLKCSTSKLLTPMDLDERVGVMSVYMVKGVGQTCLAVPSHLNFSSCCQTAGRSLSPMMRGLWMRYRSTCFSPSYACIALV